MDNEGMLGLTGKTSPRLTLSFYMPLDANTYKNNYLKNGYVNDKNKYTKKKINQYNCEFNLNADSKMRFSGAPTVYVTVSPGMQLEINKYQKNKKCKLLSLHHNIVKLFSNINSYHNCVDNDKAPGITSP